MSNNKKFYLVAIGASAGGLEAIEQFFSEMPVDSGLSFVVIQHLSPDYKSLMPEIMSKRTMLKVKTAVNGLEVEPDTIYLIPPKKNMKIFNSKLQLTEKDSMHTLNLPIDIFFKSLADDYGDRAIGVILSGSGSDGSRGIRDIKEAGGMIMAQRPDTAKFDGMPNSAITTGIVDFTLKPDQMGEKIIDYIKHPYVRDKGISEKILLKNEDVIENIIRLIKEKTGLDFAFYKPSTIIRRLERRLSINQVDNLNDYLSILYSSEQEVKILQKELLIGVTKFFRDPESFERLRQKVLPELFTEENINKDVRIWIAGCSTGEEAYSVAILCKEYLIENKLNNRVKIFATDIDQESIEYASFGVYNASIAADVLPDRIDQFFTKAGDSYRVIPEIRDMVVFARHNLTADPPFHKIDLIVCRNLLIYFQNSLQQKVFSVFNFSLNPGGFLFLGNSESVGEMARFFDTFDIKAKIYRLTGEKKVPTDKLAGLSTLENIKKPYPTGRYTPVAKPAQKGIADFATDKILDDFAPTCIVVNEDKEIEVSYGRVSEFLQLPVNIGKAGSVRLNISQMVPERLNLTFNIAISKVLKTQEPITYQNISFESYNGEKTYLDLSFKYLKNNQTGAQYVMVYFIQKHDNQTIKGHEKELDIDQQANERIRNLEEELHFTKQNLQASIEELETTNEELQATNEELISSNEELQSTNEELQSVNEELYTVNSEFQAKNQELTMMNNDMENLLTTSDLRFVFLDKDLKIRKFTENITELINLKKNDKGRPISDITHNLSDIDLIAHCKEALKEKKTIKKIIHTENRWFTMKVLPYKTSELNHDGVLLYFIEFTELKETELALKETKDKYRVLYETMSQGVVYQDKKGNIISANHAALEILGVTMDQITGKTSADSGWKSLREDGTEFPGEEHPSMQALKTGKKVNGIVMGVYNPKIQDYKWIRIDATPVFNNNSTTPDEVYTIFDDITDSIKSAEKIIKMETRWQYAIEGSGDGIWDWDVSSDKVFYSQRWKSIIGFREDEISSKFTEWKDRIHPDDKEEVLRKLNNMLISGNDNFYTEHRLKCKDGHYKWILGRGKIIEKDDKDEPKRVIGTMTDISQQKNTEERLEKRTEQFKELFNKMLNGFAIHKILTDDNGKPLDYEILEVNPAFEKIVGMRKEDVEGKRITEIIPGIEHKWIEYYGKVALTGQSKEFTEYSELLKKSFKVNAFSTKKGYFATVFEEVKD